nr:DUF1427 family protein [Caballeronia sordidicola]
MSFLTSLGDGFAVGLLYWLLKVQSPAPPLIALAGLLGMVLGEHAIPPVRAQSVTSTSAAHGPSHVKLAVAKADTAGQKETR